jgi:hypothetical protein
MLKRLVFVIVLVVLLSQVAIPTVFALGEPTGSCAPGFSLVPAMDHDDHHHLHVGTDTDLNGDGYICMRPVSPSENVHVHVDNNLP